MSVHSINLITFFFLIQGASSSFEIVETPEVQPACKNSDALVKVLNNLFEVLKVDGPNYESKIENLNNQLDTIKKFMIENPNGIQNSELYDKLKKVQEDLNEYNSELLKPTLRTSMDNGAEPKLQTKIIFKYQLPSINLPDCKDAFMKLISIAHNAYLQLAKQPFCRGSDQTAWPSYLDPQKLFSTNDQILPISPDVVLNQNTPSNVYAQYVSEMLKILNPNTNSKRHIQNQNYQSPVPNPNYPNYQNLLKPKPSYQNYQINQNPTYGSNVPNLFPDQNNQRPIPNYPYLLPSPNYVNQYPGQGYKNPFINQNPLNPFGQKYQGFDSNRIIPNIQNSDGKKSVQNADHPIDLMSILQNYRPTDNTSDLHKYFPSSSYLDKPHIDPDYQPLNNDMARNPLITKYPNPFNVTSYNPIIGDFLSNVEHASMIVDQLKDGNSKPKGEVSNQNKEPTSLDSKLLDILKPYGPIAPVPKDNPGNTMNTYNSNANNLQFLPNTGAPNRLPPINFPPQNPQSPGLNNQVFPFRPPIINNPLYPNSNQVAYHHDTIVVTGPNPVIPNTNLPPQPNQQGNLTPNQQLLKQILGQNPLFQNPNQKPVIPFMNSYQQAVFKNLLESQKLLSLQNPQGRLPNQLINSNPYQLNGNIQNPYQQSGIPNGLVNPQQNNNPNQFSTGSLDPNLYGIPNRLPNQQNVNPSNQLQTNLDNINSNYQQQGNYPTGVGTTDAKHWSDVSNLLKLNTLPVSPDMIELTYLLKRPEQFVYQPYLYVKYRLAYDTFLLKLRDLLLRKPYLRTDPVKLYRELIPNSNITEVSPDLKNFNKDDILKLVSQNSAFVDAKVVNSTNAKLNEQLKAIQNISASWNYDEILKLLNSMIRNTNNNRESLEQLSGGINDPANKQNNVYVRTKNSVDNITGINAFPTYTNKILNASSIRDNIELKDQYSLPTNIENTRLFDLNGVNQNQTKK